MNRTQQSTAITICLLGLAVLALGAVFLVREWREDVVERQRLQEENEQLRMEVEQLKAQSRLLPGELRRKQALEWLRGQRALEQVQRQLQPAPNNDGP